MSSLFLTVSLSMNWKGTNERFLNAVSASKRNLIVQYSTVGK